jgi:hypothetical protein
MVHPLLGEEDSKLHPHWLRTAARLAVQEGHENPQILGEAARACTMASLFATL